jgi:pyruvate/2-oxoglutarate dehydrogenase complex dihydrolipoamide acyltransferase (E2) component
MFSVDSFQAIQNPPQGAILAVGRGTEQVVISKSARSDSSSNDDDGNVDKPATDAVFSEDQLSTQLSISATLSIDNRCMDEADASEWLEAFADEMRKAEDFVL